ncbi:MAG: hypothetical protein F6J87_26035 [Spirulina sp. SIO3F2]|nr:hypothetical protein [Spirulina sp. SIO3F2]
MQTFAWNCGFDLIVITDQDTQTLPRSPNLNYDHQKLGSFQRRCSQVLGTEVKLAKGYKVCDLRPAFGLIFAEELSGYDYWGHIDLDTFWGNLEAFLNPILKQDYDMICGYPYHVGGPFCLYRNSKYINNLFRDNPNYIDVFKSKENKDFDEIGIKDIKYRGFEWTVRQLERQGKLTVYRGQQLYLQDCDSSWWIKETRKAIASADLQEYPTDAQPFKFGTGFWQRRELPRLTDEFQQEYAFYHFLDGKRRLFQPFAIRGCVQIKSFTIDSNGIHLNYQFGFWWLRHKLEKIIVKVLRFMVYDLGPLRHRFNLRR